SDGVSCEGVARRSMGESEHSARPVAGLYPQGANHMTVNDLRRRYDYAYWANRRLFQVMEQMTTEEFTQAVAGSYGSVRNTMVHVLSAEWGWLERCGGPPRGPQLSADDYPTVA